MADIISSSPLLQEFFNSLGTTKESLLKTAREHPQVTSAEYADGLLIIHTAVDAVPIVIGVELKDQKPEK